MNSHPSLSIGAVAGGPGVDRSWSRAVMALGRRVIELREDVSTPLCVNVVFQIPGRFLTPEFVGLRSGKFSRKDRCLQVQVALPADSTPNPDVDVRNFLRAAVELAEGFAQQEGMTDGPLVELRELANRV